MRQLKNMPLDIAQSTDSEALSRIFVPRDDIEILLLLKSLGSEIIFEVDKIDGKTQEHYQLLTLPDTLTVSRGRLARDNEFACSESEKCTGIVPEILRSKDKEVVAGFFTTFLGNINVIGPTWKNLVEYFPTAGPIPLIPDEVGTIGDTENLILHNVPRSRNWELLSLEIDTLGMYPVSTHCKVEFASKMGLYVSSPDTTDKFKEFCSELGNYYSKVNIERSRLLQDFLSKQLEPKISKTDLDTMSVTR